MTTCSSRQKIVRFNGISAVTLLTCIALSGCSSKPRAPVRAKPAEAVSETKLEIAESTPTNHALNLPSTYGRWTGDWDEVVKHRVLRLLVVYSKTGFFYDKGRPRGIIADYAEQLELSLNKKLHTRAQKFEVAIITVAPSQLLQALDEGVGDVIASSVIVSRERGALMDFTAPFYSGAKVVLVTNKYAPEITKVDDLGGHTIYVPKVSIAYGALQGLNQKMTGAGKQEIAVREADPNLTEEDLLEMTNAGLIPATPALEIRAQLWSAVLPNITVHDDIVLKENGDIAWAIRKNSPQLKAVLDDFVKKHRQGTAFGKLMFQRYTTGVKFIRNSTSSAEIKKFRAYVTYFQKYAQEYDFDYLMLGAQGYQESMLQQDTISPRGAVGIMQVIPEYAAASPINIRNVDNADGNIHAGTKMLAQIAKTYFSDPNITPMNRTMLSFAAYNAGPNRIVRLRKEAEQKGLDPNQWFGNVELVVAKDIGRETVQYVSNIYKYYVAYKMAAEQAQLREKAKQGLAVK